MDMNKKAIITILLAFVVMAGQGQVRCHVIGTVAEGTTPVELRIYRDGEDPKNSTLRPALKNGRFECDVVDAQIERWHIVDFGEVMEKGMTLRSREFCAEDGATVTIRLDGDKFNIQSTGKEYQAWHTMEQAAEEKFMSAYETLDENDIHPGAIYYTDVPLTPESELANREAVKRGIEMRAARIK